MITTVTITLPDGRRRDVQYPASSLMDEVAREILGGKEYPQIGFLETRGTAILDIGANVGLSTITLAAHYPEATIHALEPGAEAFAFLARNTAGLSNVRIYQVGAYDRDGEADLFPGRQGSVTSSLFPGGEAADCPAEKVKLRRISSFIREQGIARVSVLKVDAEGSELAILRDLAEFLEHIDAIHLEFHAEADRRAIDDLLSPRFSLCLGQIYSPHRGLLLYIARNLAETRTTSAPPIRSRT